MARINSQILLVIFFLSVSLIPMIEMSHDILHGFKNPIHFHEVSHKSFVTHSASDHHGFQKMKFAYQMEDDQHIDNLVWFAYQFSESLTSFYSTPDYIVQQHNTTVGNFFYSVHSSPPARPPRAVSLI